MEIIEQTYHVGRNKFIAFRLIIESEEQVRNLVAAYREKYHDADHLVYAFITNNSGGYSDDKEPRGTAGSAVYRLISIKKSTNILIIIVRYYGGKLGVGGLSRAYVEAAKTVI